MKMGFIFGGKKKTVKDTREEANKPPALTSSAPEKTINANGPSEQNRPKTIGELRRSGYTSLPIREEMRHNLIALIKAKKPIFNGIIGYDSTVIPQVENAVLSGQNIIFLGERGQAKSRVMRLLTGLLSEH